MSWSKQVGYIIHQKYLLSETPHEVYNFLIFLIEKQMSILYKKSIELTFLPFLQIPSHACCHINLSLKKENGNVIDDVYIKFCPTITFRDPDNSREVLFDREAYIARNKYVEEIIPSFTMSSIYDVFNLDHLSHLTKMFQMIWHQVFVLYCLERKNVLLFFF